MGIVKTKHGEAVERHFVDERQKVFRQPLQGAVKIHVFFVDVGHNRDSRREK